MDLPALIPRRWTGGNPAERQLATRCNIAGSRRSYRCPFGTTNDTTGENRTSIHTKATPQVAEWLSFT